MKTKLIVAGIIMVNIVVWSIGLIVASSNWSLLSLLLLSWTFGGRHAFDADHICIIDNTSRHLLSMGIECSTVGIYFSLGHCSVVLVIGIISIAAFNAIDLGIAGDYGSYIGIGVSASFLLLMSLFNFYTAFKLYKVNTDLNDDRGTSRHTRGYTSRLASNCKLYLLKIVNKPWKMTIIGFLFGLGLDTALEIVLIIGIANNNYSSIPKWLYILFPILFSCGMILLDGLNGQFLSHVYKWASTQDKKRFNIGIALFSALLALFISIVQYCSFFTLAYNIDNTLNPIADNFEIIGACITGVFVFIWIGLMLYIKIKN